MRTRIQIKITDYPENSDRVDFELKNKNKTITVRSFFDQTARKVRGAIEIAIGQLGR